MENRNLILSVVLCMGLLFGWQFLSSYMGWTVEPAQVSEQNQQNAQNQEGGSSDSFYASPAIPSGVEEPQLASGASVVVTTPLYKARFAVDGGVLNLFETLKYFSTDEATLRPTDKPVQLVTPLTSRYGSMGLLLNGSSTWQSANWTFSGPEELELVEGQDASISFDGELNGIQIRRTFSFDATTYQIKERTTLSAQEDKQAAVGFVISTGDIAGPEEYQRSTRVVYDQGGSFNDETSVKDLANGMSMGKNISWAGVSGNYFLGAIINSDPTLQMDTRYENGIFRVALKQTEMGMIRPGEPLQFQQNYYFGPKRVLDLEAASIEQSLDYGWFGWMARPLLAGLKFFYNFVGNWGVAIILLTVVIKIILWPLSYKSYKSMEGMKKIQPQMAKVREKFKDDKQAMNQEMMRLYKTYKINPMGGCLPILIQLPVFLGLYRALLSAIELRQAVFIEYLPFTDIIWLADLSLKDPLYITPLLMGASMFLQQKLAPPVGDPTQAKVMMFMPIIFTVMFLNFPSGLVLYWLVNNIISIGQQHWQLRRKKKD